MKILEEVISPINGKLTVIRDLTFGTYIHGGGITQSGGIAQLIWKKPLVRLQNFEIRNCLILGLGGGGIVRLIRKNWPKVKIVGVDIDPVIVDLGRKYLGLDKEGVEIVIDDAYNFVAKKPQLKSWDLVCVDIYLGQEYPRKFEERKFIEGVKKVLGKNGFAVFNRLYYEEKRIQAVRFLHLLEKTFSKVDVVYPKANIMFICSS